MHTKLISDTPYRAIGWTVLGLVLLLIVLEGWRYAIKPNQQRKDQIITENLREVSDRFTSYQKELLDESQHMAQELQAKIEQEYTLTGLYNITKKYPHLWGAALFQGTEPVVWRDFSLEPFRAIHSGDDLHTYIKVQKQRNVLYWICHIYFTIPVNKGEIPYHLYTTRRIKQTNALPIGKGQEYNMLQTSTRRGNYPLALSIYNPLPKDAVSYQTLRTLSQDSVGVVYAGGNHFKELIAAWETSTRFWRSTYAIICFVVISILMFFWLGWLGNWKSLFFRLIIVGIAWVIFDYISIAARWIPELLDDMRPEQIASYKALCAFSINAIFLFIATFTLFKSLKGQRFKMKSTWFLGSMFAAFIAGIINTIAILIVFEKCYILAYYTSFSLLTLQVFPEAGTLGFYLAMGIMLLALTTGLVAINRFLLRSCLQHYKLVTAILIISFLLTLIAAQLFVASTFRLNWGFLICVIYFLIVFGVSFIAFKYINITQRFSPLRYAAIVSVIISIAGSVLIYHAGLRHIDAQLQEVLTSSNRQDNPKAKELTGLILSRLESQFHSLTKEELDTRVSYIQSRFTETIESTLANKEQLFSFDLQLIKSNKQLVADYSTNLNSPDWTSVFDLPRLKATMQINSMTKISVRPIVQQPILINAKGYKTFYRGWIPLFGDNKREPIAWILCSVFQERPNFNKPMRAVIASLNYNDWYQSFAIQQYQNGKLTHVSYQGISDYYPVYNVLQPAEKKALQQDSTQFYTSTDEQQTYRNFLKSQSGSHVTKASTILPDYQHILFSFFRFNFTLLIAGLVLLTIYQLVATRHISFFGENERFQYRILDSFLLATLVFLVLLVFATHYAIKYQNKDLVQQQLVDKLESITETRHHAAGLNTIALSLDSLATPLNADATFYYNRLVTESTTPQIYQQHLLPGALPFPVYDNLFVSQKRDAVTTVMIDKQMLLIGYRSVLSSKGEPVAAIAIPTFVQSPKYNQQLLQTTSFLIILYLVVFGIFIVGTTFISMQLTRPLDAIQRGLHKISEGSLKTRIPVHSKDEIGGLAVAYNQMVSRLKELQDELAEAEREAAWKEMAQQVAHEIKNPLTPMKLNIQHLQRQLSSGDYTVEELKERITKITKNLIVQIQSLNNIASDFSKFSQPIEEEFTDVDINELVDSVTDLYRNDEQISFQTEYAKQVLIASGAPDELRRIFINLIKNAYEAMPHGGTITLRTYSKQGNIFIEVEDDGEGVREEDKPRIFVPNFSTKSSGTGLGLAICKKVIEAHEGSISFASIKGKGTTFVIKLPLKKTA